MSDDAEERVRDLLDGAAAAVDSLPEEPDARDADALRDVADEAASILESTDSRDLLAAVGLGDEAESIPGAIARGDADAVGDLRALLVLSSLSGRSDADGDDALAEDVAEVRDLVSDRAGDGEATDEGAGETADDGSAGETADQGEGDAGDREAGDALEEQLRSAVGDALGGFGDDVREAKDRLEALAGEGSEDAAGDEGSEGGDGGDEDQSVEDESDEGDWIGRGDDSGSGRHSTVAPPPSDRADMSRSGRLSTMPDRETRSDL